MEGLIFVPHGKGPFPLVTHIHGHNEGSGAWGSALMGYFLQQEGFATFLPSQFGYGIKRNIKPDFCGPRTVRGIIDGVKEVLKLDFVDKQKIGIWGISRGTTVASQVITKEPKLFQCAVLQSGVYDMKKEFEKESLISGIKENMINESGGTNKAWKERSSIYHMDRVNCPVLILHGDLDDRVGIEQARLLDQKLTELKKEHETVILPGLDHFITKQTRREYTFPFLQKYLK